MIETRRIYAELRAAPNRTIIGRAMRYGAEAIVRMRDGREVRERFAAFAFNSYIKSGAATRLNLQHDQTLTVASTGPLPGRGTLRLRDNPDGLDMEARLPSGDAYDRVLALVSDGSTAETSVEFRSLSDSVVGDRRTVLQATLPGIGIVDKGAYGSAGSVETRRRAGTLRARIDYNRRLDCECNPNCQFAKFDPGSLSERPREALAVAGEYTRPVAATSKGTLRLLPDDSGLNIEVDLPDPANNEAVRAILEAAAVGVFARPFLDTERSEFTDDGEGLRTYQRAVIRAIIIGATDKSGGLEAAQIVEPQRAEPARRRVWL